MKTASSEDDHTMFTLLAGRFRRDRDGDLPEPRSAVTPIDPYAGRRRAMQRVQAAELAHLGEFDEVDEESRRS